MNGETQNEQLQDWADLLKAVRESNAELRNVEPFVEVLEKNHREAARLRRRRDALVASAMEATGQLNKAFAASRDAARALRCYVRGVIGPRSPKLERFGIKPLRKRVKR